MKYKRKAFHRRKKPAPAAGRITFTAEMDAMLDKWLACRPLSKLAKEAGIGSYHLDSIIRSFHVGDCVTINKDLWDKIENIIRRAGLL